MAYNVDDKSAEDIAPLGPAQRRSTLPARFTTSPPLTTRYTSRSPIAPPFATGSGRQLGLRGRNNVVVPDEALPQNQSPPVIINNYIGADSGDSVDNRSRTRSRRQGRSYYDYEEDEDDRVYRRKKSGRASSPSYLSSSASEEEDSDDSHFTLSYSSVFSEFLEDRALSIDSDTPFLSIIPATPSRTTNTMHIYQAQYTGDACQEDNHTSKLILLHAPRHPQHTLFRWIHIEQPVMNFNGFWNEIAGISNLTRSEKGGIKKLLQDVKSRGIKQFVTTNGGHKVMQTKGLLMRKLQFDDTEISTTRRRAIYWVNLPYFELKKYSSEKNSSELFPARTLMQADYSRHLMSRDMQQAVRQIKEGPAEHCFHISQLWGIIVENSLLVTCSTMPNGMLRKDKVEMSPEPPKENSGRILVEYYENILWTIPLQECLTWFEFITHFWEFWPLNVQFYRQNKLLSSSDWPDIVESAKNGTKRISLTAIKKPRPSPPPRGVLTPITKLKTPVKQPDASKVSTNSTEGATIKPGIATSSISTADKLSQESKSFGLFAWIKANPGISKTKAATRELQSMDQFIQEKASERDRLAYSMCCEATPDEVRAKLERLESEKNLQGLDKESSIQQALRDRFDVFNYVVVIFTCFLPLQFVGPIIIGKAWGSLQQLLDRPWPEDGNVEEPLNWKERQNVANSTLLLAKKGLRSITRKILLFQQVMLHAPDTDKAGIKIPDQLLQAYIYFVLALAQASVNTDLYLSRMDKFFDCLQKGMRAMLKSFSPKSLLTYCSLVPTDILSLMSSRLLKDVTEPWQNIHTVYSEWIKILEKEIETKPSPSHQEKIQWLNAEINIIQEVLRQQNLVFHEISKVATLGFSNVITGQSVAPGRSHRAPNLEWTRRRNVLNQTQTRTHTRSRERYREAENSGPAPVHYAEGIRSHAYVRGYEPEGSVYSADQYGQDDPENGFGLSALDPGGYRQLLADDCKRIIEDRLSGFTEFQRRTAALMKANTYKTETRKSYQEQAVYAFTIVTIIFLPLSAISSIFGMNTSDIRELEQGQWLYWATAVPVTVGVIIIGLWWMGELGNATLWLINQRQQQFTPAMVQKEYVQPRLIGTPPSDFIPPPAPPTDIDGLPRARYHPTHGWGNV